MRLNLSQSMIIKFFLTTIDNPVNRMMRLIIIINILTFNFSCQKDEPQCRITRQYLPQDLKDYCDFPVGSYWIYKDSISGAIDSVYLFKKTRSCTMDDNCNDCPSHSGDGVQVRINETFTDYLISSFYNDTIMRIGSAGSQLDNKAYYKYEWGYFPFSFGLTPDTNFTPENGVGYIGLYLAFHDSLHLLNRIYNNVKVFADYSKNKDSLENIKLHYRLVHYFSENIGIIKFILEGSIFTTKPKCIWELQRFNIKK